ncbi:MAG: VCBS repeat-containing protein, partial [Pyrinomonadaceae bacterium]|nr:VCBS repeat-containing protein [Pyrinomonadaceae bacterium]
MKRSARPRGAFDHRMLLAFGILLGLAGILFFSITGVAETSAVAACSPWSEQAHPSVSDSVLLGTSTAISGNTMVAGAPSVGTLSVGAAYVFTRNGSSWGLQQKLTAADGIAGDEFGISVGISGDTIVVGSDRDDETATNQGSAYVFTRSGSTWTQQQKLIASDAAAEDRLGFSIAVSGDTVVVGASLDDAPGQTNQGSAYIFTRSGTEWSEQQKIVAADGLKDDEFGNSLAIQGNTVVIGAYRDDVAAFDSGSVYVFTRTGTTWALQQKLTASDGSLLQQLGYSVAFDGETVVAGAHFDDTPNSDQGSAYVFTMAGTVWSQQQKLIASDGAQADLFGQSVGISGNALVVGAMQDDAPAVNQGSAYVFTRTGTVWGGQQKLLASDGVLEDWFGAAVAMAGNTVVVGAPRDDSAVGQEGSAYVYRRECTFRRTFDYDGDGKTDFSVFRPSSGAWYLQRSTAGFQGLQFGADGDKLTPADYDGDGKTDIAVYRPSSGTWYILNSSNGTVSYPVFGIAEDLPAPGDYDGDGKADITVFRPSQGTWYRTNSSNGTTFGMQFGANGDVPTVGDFDGDGKHDLGIFRPSVGDWYNIRSSNGSVFGERFGQTGDRIAPADYDGDGKTDIAIYRPSTGLWVVRKSATATYSYEVFGLPADVPISGDYDGDGKADIGVWRPSDGTWYIK